MPAPEPDEDPTLLQRQQLAKCFNCLNHTQKMGVAIWLMAKSLKALGEEDWTDLSVLKKAIACYTCEPDDILESFMLWSFYWLATHIPAIPEMSPADLIKEAPCWQCLDPKTLKAAFVFLIGHLVETAQPE